MTELTKARREADLYRRLLALGTQPALDGFLREALGLVVEVTDARRGYLELKDPAVDGDDRWSIAHGFSDAEVEGIRHAISRGIVAEALATGRTIITPSALADPRFRDRESVQGAAIEAVLCAPVGEDPPMGVLYLERGDGAPGFTEEDRANAEIFARHLAPSADRLLIRARTEPDPTAPYRARLALDGVIGRSPVLASLLHQVGLVAPLDISVLLTGESGTGKSQMARVIHTNGPRAPAPFVELNCAALPETLLESELFGALPGAHSAATRRIEGKVAAAEHGTLFLDEITEMSPSAQGKLLQLLQERSYFPLGATKAVRADVRIIAATNVDLDHAVRERQFRHDLLYRLQVMPIRVPSLAERRGDVADLARFFCAGACERHSLPRVELSNGAVRAAETAEWPGNVRQLGHAIEAAVVRAVGERAHRVERAHLFPEERRDPVAERPLTFQEATQRFQADTLRHALVDADWNVTEVARRLDLARSHVYNLIRAFGLRRGDT